MRPTPGGGGCAGMWIDDLHHAVYRLLTGVAPHGLTGPAAAPALPGWGWRVVEP